MLKVSGASGFIGSAVLEFCRMRSIPVEGYTRSKKMQSEGLIYVPSYDLIPEGGTLVHLGEHNNIGTINADIMKSQEQVAFSLSQKKFEKIVYASSAAVYGNHLEAIPPDSVCFSQTPYAISKRANEKVFLNAGHIVVRLSNVYGPGMSDNNVLTTVMKQGRQSIIRVQNTKPVRDYIWVKDVASALIELSASDFSMMFHVSTGVGTSVLELIRLVCEIEGNESYSIEETLPGDGSKVVLSSDETQKSIGWTPSVNLRSGLTQMIGQV